MAITIRTIDGFRQEMKRSITAFYANRGLSGKNLFAFAENLQQIADKMRNSKASKDDIKKALAAEQAGLLRFSQPFKTEPLNDGSFIVINPGGLTEAETGLTLENRFDLVFNLLKIGYAAMIRGTIGSEGHYAGLGTRLESDMPKFTMTANDLLAGLEKFAGRINDPKFKGDKTYLTLNDQLAELGGIEAVKTKFGSLRKWTIGERIFLAKLFDIRRVTQKFAVTDDEFRRITRSLKFKIIVNEQSGGRIIENFVKVNFFGLDPRNIIFMNQAQHPTWEVSPNGEPVADAVYQSQGNHGLIPFQANLEDQWFRIVPDALPRGYREEKISAEDYRCFQENITTLVVESVEDTYQYVQPYDYTYLAYVEKLGLEQGIQMFMKIVGQKEKNPQKGGFLAAITDANGRTRNAVIESNRTPELKPGDITNLNLNRNAFYNPNAVDRAILAGKMIEDLHPTFEPQGKELLVRIDPKIPQGDRNFSLVTRYIKDNPPASISNLKDPVDIIPTLLLMQRMEYEPGIIKFAEQLRLT